MRVGYLLGHYPTIAQSFLRTEIRGLETPTFQVMPVALNAARPADLQDTLNTAEAARTYYVKSTPKAKILGLLARQGLRHPGDLTRYFAGAMAEGGTNPRNVAWRGFQALEGLLAWEHFSRQGVRHIHAQFAGAPARVARDAVAWQRRRGGTPWTWSVTVHGPHDFFNEQAAGLDIIGAEAAAIVTISDYGRAQMLRHTPPERWDAVQVVRCGIPMETFPMREPSATPIASPTVLCTGRLAPEKGQHILLHAVRARAAAGQRVLVRFVGDGPEREALVRTARELGIQDQVSFLGTLPQQEVARELARADVFCLPSFAEGIPVSLMEAMATGVPVIATRIAGIPELVTDDTGWCVTPGDPTAVADALAQVSSDVSLRVARVHQARQHVCQQHDAALTLPPLRDLFTDLCQRRISSPHG